MCNINKLTILDRAKKVYKKMLNLYLLFIITFILACETKKNSFYIKARNNEENKIGAFEICGRNFEIIEYQEDTALIKCNNKK